MVIEYYIVPVVSNLEAEKPQARTIGVAYKKVC